MFFLCWYYINIYLYSDDLYSESTLVLGLRTYGLFLMFYLNSRRWFVLWFVCIPYLVLVQVSGDRHYIYFFIQFCI
jgi:hypothetical protein